MQLELINSNSDVLNNKTNTNRFPQTRYQGSKLKLTEWLKEIFITLDFEFALDAFGGTGAVSYLLKNLNKEVHYNDILKFNSIIGKGLIENNFETLSAFDIQTLLHRKNKKYFNIIERNFSDIYYLDEENVWLDFVIQNIYDIECDYKKSLAFWALFQACLVKRPYNLFHRKNLYVRTSEVERSFGNKATWDKGFEDHFVKFIEQGNASIFNNGRKNLALNQDASTIKNSYDLVYVDTPYIPQKGSITNYHEFYHFLEGVADYFKWEDRIDFESKHKKLKTEYNPWCDKKAILSSFDEVIENFKDSIIVLSYREDGIPSIDELKKLLKRHNKKVTVDFEEYKYALSIKKDIKETILIAE